MHKLWIKIIAFIFIIVFITTFNYGGCGGGKGKSTSGSSTGTFSLVTESATNISHTSVKLNGTVNPAGISTEVYFQWGTTTNYTNLNVSADLTELIPDTEYNYRIK